LLLCPSRHPHKTNTTTTTKNAPNQQQVGVVKNLMQKVAITCIQTNERKWKHERLQLTIKHPLPCHFFLLAIDDMTL
jgi:hypothetical protein